MNPYPVIGVFGLALTVIGAFALVWLSPTIANTQQKENEKWWQHPGVVLLLAIGILLILAVCSIGLILN